MFPWFPLIFVIVYGACVGSFLNVVICRLPEGKSLVRPGSHCPRCGHMLRWWENVPVLAWFYLLGKCRRCKEQISIQYPLVEATCGLLFALTYWSYYLSDLRPQFGGLDETWPVLLVHLTLIAALFAATVVDARLYIIPLEIPWFATAVALIVLPISAIWLSATVFAHEHPVVPEATGPILWASVGATIGLVAALVLLKLRWLPRSFDDEQLGDAEQPLAPEAFLAHSHPRREVLKECLFLLLPALGAVVGYVASLNAVPLGVRAVEILGGVVLGYLVGGAIVWMTRIAGTIGFGKEAMGLGDVHLLAAIGAVLGWQDTIVVFFVAPFMGLLYTLVAFGLRKMMKGEVRVIPYGPYLAAAALLMMIGRKPMHDFLHVLEIPLS